MPVVRFTLAAIATFVCLASAAQSGPDQAYETLATKFGPLEYMRPSHDIRLHGKVLVQSGQHTDPDGFRLYLLEAESYASPHGRSTIQGPTGGLAPVSPDTAYSQCSAGCSS